MTAIANLPAPLTPVDCDLRDFAFMPLDVVRLRDSDLAVTAEADEFRCAVLLWCASWHQVPAASLPDDDKVLAQYAGYGRVVKEWMKVRTGALRGWVKCADGRLYHPVVAEKANEAWLAKLRQRLRTECSRIKKHNERHGTRLVFPEFDAWMEAGCPVGQPLFVPSDKPAMSLGHDANVTGENHSKGQGEGQGQLKDKNKSSSSQPPTPRDDDSSFGPPTEPGEGSHRNHQIVALLLAQDIVTTSGNPFVLDWAQDPKVTDDVLKVAIAKARKAKAGEEIVPKYLAKTIATVLDEQSAVVPAAMARAAAAPIPIRKPQGADPKGPDESYEDWEARVNAAERAMRKGSNP